MFLLPTEFNGILKASFGEDTRRLKLHLPVGSSAEDVIAIVQEVVHKAFGFEEQQFSLTFTSKEGNGCTLSELAEQQKLLASGSTLRVQVTLDASLLAARVRKIDTDVVDHGSVEHTVKKPACFGLVQQCESDDTDGQIDCGLEEAPEATSLRRVPVQCTESRDTAFSPQLETAAWQVHLLQQVEKQQGLVAFLNAWFCGRRSSTKEIVNPALAEDSFPDPLLFQGQQACT